MANNIKLNQSQIKMIRDIARKESKKNLSVTENWNPTVNSSKIAVSEVYESLPTNEELSDGTFTVGETTVI